MCLQYLPGGEHFVLESCVHLLNITYCTVHFDIFVFNMLRFRHYVSPLNFQQRGQKGRWGALCVRAPTTLML